MCQGLVAPGPRELDAELEAKQRREEARRKAEAEARQRREAAEARRRRAELEAKQKAEAEAEARQKAQADREKRDQIQRAMIQRAMQNSRPPPPLSAVGHAAALIDAGLALSGAGDFAGARAKYEQAREGARRMAARTLEEAADEMLAGLDAQTPAPADDARANEVQ